jgi:hypothetical protein
MQEIIEREEEGLQDEEQMEEVSVIRVTVLMDNVPAGRLLSRH